MSPLPGDVAGRVFTPVLLWLLRRVGSEGLRDAIAAVFVPAGLSLAGLTLIAEEADLAGVEVAGAAAAAALVVDDDLRVAESAEAAQGETAMSVQRGMGEGGCVVSVVMAFRLPVTQCMRSGSLALHALPPAG